MDSQLLQNTQQLDNMIETQRSLIEPIIMECLQLMFHYIPKGESFMLSNRKTAHFKTFVEPRINEDTGSYEFGIDVVIDAFPVRHIEFMMKKTGQGGPPIEAALEEE